MSRPRAVLGGASILFGLVWIGQGLRLIPGSFMTGEPFWAAAGLLVVVVGAWLIRSSRAISR